MNVSNCGKQQWSKRRTLIQVKIEDISDAENRIGVLMGEDVEPKRMD